MTRELSRFYHTDERITTLLAKLTNQMCLRCVAYVEAPAKLWEQPITELLARLAHAIAVEGAYRTEYGRIVREISEKCLEAARRSPVGGANSDTAAVRPLRLDERLIFGKLELLTNRMEKVSHLFETVHQFGQLIASDCL